MTTSANIVGLHQETSQSEPAKPAGLEQYVSLLDATVSGDQGSDMGKVRAAVLAHPLYPQLLMAHIECKKVGVSQELAARLDELLRNLLSVQPRLAAVLSPELDNFMADYITMLGTYRQELEKPFLEARAFCDKFDERLSSFSRSLTENHTGDACISGEEPETEEASGSGSDEDSVQESEDDGVGPWDSRGVDPMVDDAALKEQLKQRYLPYLSTLKQDCLKKRKKGKLPKEATQALLDWWQKHLGWPYPTENEKTDLAEMTGLDSKQINNWFINQRKRHWTQGGAKTSGKAVGRGD